MNESIRTDKELEQLLSEVKQCLKERNQGQLAYLLNDEDQKVIQFLKSKISQKDFRKVKAVIKANQLEKQKAQTKQKQEEMFTVNKQIIVEVIDNQQQVKQQLSLYDSQQIQLSSQLQQQKPRKQRTTKQKSNSCIKLENRPNYPYFGVIKNMMYANGLAIKFLDQEKVKMMHSQCQAFFQTILPARIFQKYKQKNNQKTNANKIEKYLAQIVPQQYQFFVNIYKQVKKIKQAEKQDIIHQQSQDQPFHSDSQSQKDNSNESHQESRKLNNNIHFYMKQTVQQIKYFTLVTQNMTPEEFNKFTRSRQINFLYHGKQQLSLFISTNPGIVIQISNKFIYQLISFIGCRFVRKIIFKIIRANNNQTLKPVLSIEKDQIKFIGNQIIANYMQRVRKYFIQFETKKYDQIAFQTFSNQFYVLKYISQFIPKQIINQTLKILDLKQVDFGDSNIPKIIWEKHPKYKKMWTDRIITQQAFIQQQFSKGKVKRYLNMLIENKLRSNDTKKNNGQIWLNFIKGQEQASQDAQQSKTENKGAVGRKRRKLQSIAF